MDYALVCARVLSGTGTRYTQVLNDTDSSGTKQERVSRFELGCTYSSSTLDTGTGYPDILPVNMHCWVRNVHSSITIIASIYTYRYLVVSMPRGSTRSFKGQVRVLLHLCYLSEAPYIPGTRIGCLRPLFMGAESSEKSEIFLATFGPKLWSITLFVHARYGAMKVLCTGTTNQSAQQRVLCLLYTSPSPRDGLLSRMPSSA